MFRKLMKITTPIIFILLLFISSEVKAATFTDNQTVDVNKKWTIKFNKEVLLDDFTKQNIKVTDSNGNIVNTTLSLGNNNKNVIVNAPTGGYKEGARYKLIIGDKVHSKDKKDLKQSTTVNFNIKKKEDTANKSAYALIYNALLNFDDEVDISRYTKSSGFSELVDVLNDHPEIFYFKYEGSSFSTNSILKLQYIDSKENVLKMKKEFDNKVNNIINSCIKEGMTDLEKELAIHDYIVLNTKYDYDNYARGTLPRESYNPYGVLVKGTGVCEGYAETMKLLLNKVGIECDVVSGQANGGAHGWNIVKIDGQYYHVDATWDDPVPDKKGCVRYKYFNISDKQMGQDHKDWKSDKICSSEKLSYYSNMQYMVKDKEWMYYSDVTDEKLYKIKIDGTNKTKLTDDRPMYITTFGDWIYFSNYSRGGRLYKIKKDGTEPTQLNNVDTSNIYIENNKLYYTNESTGKAEYIECN